MGKISSGHLRLGDPGRWCTWVKGVRNTCFSQFTLTSLFLEIWAPRLFYEKNTTLWWMAAPVSLRVGYLIQRAGLVLKTQRAAPLPEAIAPQLWPRPPRGTMGPMWAALPGFAEKSVHWGTSDEVTWFLNVEDSFNFSKCYACQRRQFDPQATGVWGGDGISINVSQSWGFSSGSSGKEPACQCRRCKGYRFDPWVRKIPWKRAWLLTLVLLPGESHGQKGLAGYSAWGLKELGMTEATWHSCIPVMPVISKTLILPLKMLPKSASVATIHRIDNQPGPTGYQRVLYSVFYNSLNRKRILKR